MNTGLTIQLADSWGMHGDVGAGWMIVMMIFMVLFWALVILGIVWLVRGFSVGGWSRERKETPNEILERRFAEGAISVEDYTQRKDVLAGARTAPQETLFTDPK